MLGVECVDNILFGSQELTLEFPNIVNPRKNMELKVGAGGLAGRVAGRRVSGCSQDGRQDGVEVWAWRVGSGGVGCVREFVAV
jgi:hypothetical protein